MTVLQSGVKGLAKGQEDFEAAVTTQVNLLGAQIQQVLSHLTKEPPPADTVTAVSSATAGTAPAPVLHTTALHLSPPEKFSGESGECSSFLVSCDMHFEYLPSAFSTERSKVAFMVSHLTGRARAWATAEWSSDSAICGSVEEFQQALRRTFNPTSSDREKARELSNINQNKDTVGDYAIRFRTLAADSGWNTMALCDIFFKGLSAQIREQLVPLNLPSDLNSLITLAIRTDNRLRELHRSQNTPTPAGSRHWSRATATTPSGQSSSGLPVPAPHRTMTTDTEEPMQLGRTRLSPEERRRRLQEGRCFYCGQQGHLLASCPAKGQAH